jgi:hypothetical protein
MKRKSYSSGCVENGLDLKHFFFSNRPYSDVGGSRGEEKSSALDIRGDICENPIKCDHVICSLTGHLLIPNGNRGDWMINMSNVINFIPNDYYSSLVKA